MPNLASPEVVHYRPCWEGNDVQPVLETLARHGSRVSQQLLSMRRHSRAPYITQILVGHKYKGKLKNTTKAILPVLGRDLSRSGAGLLSPVLFEPQIQEEETALIRAANLFREGAVLDLGLQRPSGEWLWLYGTCVRVCTVQHDFLDVGIRFNGRRNLALDFDFI